MTSVIVIGGGHNGLVAAWHLAKSGASVTVLERADELGGVCRAIEFAPGYVAPGLFHDVAFDAQAFSGLAVEHAVAPPTWVATESGMRSIGPELTEVDGAEAWREFMRRVKPFVRAVLSSVPPPILPTTTSDLYRLGRTGLGLRRLGRADMTELMRVPPMCAADWVNEHFASSPALAEWVASAGVLHGFAGPWSAGTAANLLLDAVMRTEPIAGGPPAIVEALERACTQAGVTIRTSAKVQRINIESGHVTGVELAGGETIASDLVLATCDPRTTMLGLLDPVHLPAKVERQFLAVRARGTTAKLMLALDGALDLEGAENVARAYIGGGSIDGLERAYDAVKYGEFSEKPVLDISVPTVAQPELAPDGHHVVSILVSFVPYELRAGWTDDARSELQERALRRLSEHAPAVRDRIVATELWTPPDLEREFGLSGGCLHHVEHALDQLFFMRPTPSAARYATPIGGLFLGGGGSHPCGGVTGLPGRLAAEQMSGLR